METKNKTLFCLIDSIGERLEGDFHIIDNTELVHCDGERTYRIYHKDGYCFDISKELESENEETGEENFYYGFFSEWPGFDDLKVEKAIELLKNHKS
jgi:hypothetical protein